MSDDSSNEPGIGDGRLTRRSFLATAGMAGVAAAVDARDVIAQSPGATAAAPSAADGTVPVALRVNGKDYRLTLDPRTTLLDCLRETLQPHRARRRDAITASAAPAPSTSTAGG